MSKVNPTAWKHVFMQGRQLFVQWGIADAQEEASELLEDVSGCHVKEDRILGTKRATLAMKPFTH